jgi:excisionase family DNA binding protein
MSDKSAVVRKEADFISVRQAAEKYGVCDRTIVRWVRDGILQAVQPKGPRGKLFVVKA